MSKHGFETAFRSGRKVNEVQNKVKTSLGEGRRYLCYEIICKWGECVYIGQTEQRWDERKKQHQDNIRYARAELDAGTESGRRKAHERMNGNGGGLVKHVVLNCDKGIEWESSGPIASVKGWKQRRTRESVETWKRQMRGKTVLNQCDHLDQGWKDILEMKL